MYRTLLLLAASFSTVSAYIIYQIENFEGASELIEFDSSGNAYIYNTNNGNNYLYKISPDKEILWKTDVEFQVHKIIINSKSDIYVFLINDDLEITVNIIKSNTSTLLEIDKVSLDSRFIIDNDDNLIYNRDDGVYILRPDQTTPTLIKNLEWFNFRNEHTAVVDNDGNIYLGIDGLVNWNHSLAIVTKESKQRQTPVAEIFEIDYGHYIEDSLIDERGDLWIFTTDFIRSGYIKKLTNGTLETILYDEKFEFHQGVGVKDRIVVVSMTNNSYTAPTYFIKLENHEIVQIPDLANVTWKAFASTKVIADKDGNVWFGSRYKYDKGVLVYIKYNEIEATAIQFDRNISMKEFLFDGNEEIWVVTELSGVYNVKKGENVAGKVEAPQEFEMYFTNIKLNKVTNEVFVLSDNGLYVVAA